MTSAPSRPRSGALDIARGLAVIGVVFNHSVTGVLGSGLGLPGAVTVANEALYLCRLSALLLLIGLFIPGGARRHGAAVYAARRARLVVYLYLLWFVIQTSIEVTASGLRNNPRGWSALLHPWVTYNQLWFLPLLAVVTAMMAACAPWRSSVRAVSTVVAAAALSIATWAWNPPVVGVNGLSLVLFAAVGATVGLPVMVRSLDGPTWCWAAAGIAAGAGLVVAVQAGAVAPSVGVSRPSLPVVGVSVIGSCCGVVVVLAVAVAVARFTGPLASALSRVGRSTLAVFLAHELVIGAVRIGLLRGIHVDAAGVVLALMVAAGVVIPLLGAGWARSRPWARWLFEEPRWLSAAGRRAEAVFTR